jgi:hypothetical protein
VIFFSIKDGATLQLVLAMRGGPINMKRGVKYFHGYQLLSIYTLLVVASISFTSIFLVPVDNSLREMAEYVEANRFDNLLLFLY